MGFKFFVLSVREMLIHVVRGVTYRVVRSWPWLHNDVLFVFVQLFDECTQSLTFVDNICRGSFY